MTDFIYYATMVDDGDYYQDVTTFIGVFSTEKEAVEYVEANEQSIFTSAYSQNVFIEKIAIGQPGVEPEVIYEKHTTLEAPKREMSEFDKTMTDLMMGVMQAELCKPSLYEIAEGQKTVGYKGQTIKIEHSVSFK